MKHGLDLDRVVLLGRTLDEYARYFALEEKVMPGLEIADVASGVSSFCAEAHLRGWDVTAVDPIYAREPEDIRAQSEPDLEYVVKAIEGLEVYRWSYYQNPARMRGLRERACAMFLEDYARHRGARYVAARLPYTPFADRQFDLTLVSYLLFAYQERLSYEFHRNAILELMRITRGEARIYPTVTFEAQRSEYVDKLRSDPALADFLFEVVQTDFEFLANSNNYLRIAWR